MSVRITSLQRCKTSGSWKARKAIPAAIRDAYAEAFGPKHEAKFSAPAELSERDAKNVFAEWHAEIESRFKGLRDKAAGKGQKLSHRERYALIGVWHEWFAGQHGTPGKVSDWEAYTDQHTAALQAICQRFADETDGPAGIEEFDWATHPQAKPLALAQISSAARVDAFLAERMELLTQTSKEEFLEDLAPELLTALARLQRVAGGDYSASVNAERFPKRNKTAGLIPTQLFAAYVSATAPSKNTVIRWRDIFNQLDRFFPGRDVGSLTEQDAHEWRESLRPVSPRKVSMRATL